MSGSRFLMALFVQKMYEKRKKNPVSMTNSPVARTMIPPILKYRGEDNLFKEGVVLNYNYKLVY